MVPIDPLFKFNKNKELQFLISLFLASECIGLMGLMTIKSLSQILLKSLFYRKSLSEKLNEVNNNYNGFTNWFLKSVIV